jgi:Leucine-rich repeat (LRR) protein
MPIARVGKFLETADLGIVHSLGIESAQLSDCISEINQRGVRGVFGCPVFGFKESNLDFLSQLNDIRQVWFWEIHLQDISGLYSQKGLEYFGISPKRPAIDFSYFTGLRDMVWQPIKHDAGVEKLKKLERLDVWRYKTKDMSFTELQLPQSLQKLEFNWCNQDSVSTLPALPNLEELQFHYCRNLRSLNGLMASAPNLKKLVVTRCANLESFEEALSMDLEHVYINVRGKEMANNSINRTR